MKKNVINEDGTGSVMTMRGLRVFGATSRHEYIFPILEGLAKNKSLTNGQITTLIENQFVDRFNDIDKEYVSGGTIRWRKNLAWLKYQMKKDGFIEVDEPNHTWRLTKKGSEYHMKLKKTN